jgi:DNA-binding transcriptional regulator YiaG
MQSKIRIIKHNPGATTNTVPADQSERTVSQRERDTANTVKSWVAEWEARNRMVQAAAFSLLRSLENRSESSTRRFALVKG